MTQHNPNPERQPASELALPILTTRRQPSDWKKLPQELVGLICRVPSLSKFDLKSLRLTTKLWRDAAAEPLFETVTISPFETFLDPNALSRVARHVSTLNLLGKNLIALTPAPAGHVDSRHWGRTVRKNHKYAPYPLPPFFGPHVFFAALKSLKLSKIDAGHDRLLKFLLAHSKKLEEVEFNNVHITETPWKTIIIGMAQQMKLKKVKFGGMLVQRCYPKIWKTDQVWYVSTHTRCFGSGESHDGCLKGRIENYVVNGGDWVPNLWGPRDKKYTKAKLCKYCGVQHMGDDCEKVDGQEYDWSWSTRTGVWHL